MPAEEATLHQPYAVVLRGPARIEDEELLGGLGAPHGVEERAQGDDPFLLVVVEWKKAD